MKQLTLKIPTEVHKKLKLLAVQEDRTMASIIVECIEARCKGKVGLPKPVRKRGKKA